MKIKMLMPCVACYLFIVNVAWAINYGLMFEEKLPHLSDTPEYLLMYGVEEPPTSIEDLKLVGKSLGGGDRGVAYLYSDERVYKVPTEGQVVELWEAAETNANRWNFFYQQIYDGEFSHYATAKVFPLKVYQNDLKDAPLNKNILSTPHVKGSIPVDEMGGLSWQQKYAAELTELKAYFNRTGQTMHDIDIYKNHILATGPKSNMRRLLVIDFDVVIHNEIGISPASDAWHYEFDTGSTSSSSGCSSGAHF